MVTDKILVGFHVLDDRKLSRFYGGERKEGKLILKVWKFMYFDFTERKVRNISLSDLVNSDIYLDGLNIDYNSIPDNAEFIRLNIYGEDRESANNGNKTEYPLILDGKVIKYKGDKLSFACMLFSFIGCELNLVVDLTRKAFGLGLGFDKLYYLDRFSFLNINYSNSETYRCYTLSIKELDTSGAFEAKQGVYRLFNGTNLVVISNSLDKVVVLESDADNIKINRVHFGHSNYGVKIVIPPSVKSIEFDGYRCKDELNLYVKRDKLRDLFLDYYILVRSRDRYRFNSEYHSELFRFTSRQEFGSKSDEEIVAELNKVFNINLALY